MKLKRDQCAVTPSTFGSLIMWQHILVSKYFHLTLAHRLHRLGFMFERLARRYMIDKRTGFNKIELLFVPPFFFSFSFEAHILCCSMIRPRIYIKWIDQWMSVSPRKKEVGLLYITPGIFFYLQVSSLLLFQTRSSGGRVEASLPWLVACEW